MDKKLDLILNEIAGVRNDMKVLKENQLELKTIVTSIKEAQEISNAKTSALESIQERQQLLIETLSYRSIQQETELKEMKRIIQNL
jgi:uncharacterized protein YlxP (DUF503 family)